MGGNGFLDDTTQSPLLISVCLFPRLEEAFCGSEQPSSCPKFHHLTEFKSLDELEAGAPVRSKMTLVRIVRRSIKGNFLQTLCSVVSQSPGM